MRTYHARSNASTSIDRSLAVSAAAPRGDHTGQCHGSNPLLRTGNDLKKFRLESVMNIDSECPRIADVVISVAKRWDIGLCEEVLFVSQILSIKGNR